jgi:bifunctional DNA-binding transcriptional regulator/antitoxin component of YhaV-PrlF toxin-antitoxin module
MPQNVSHLRVVLASPGDVKAERNGFARLVDQINNDTGRRAGVQFELWTWETDAKPGFHPEGPQGGIDQVLRIEECDLFVGIFWNRIGTPTPAGKTGTEHEFATAYTTWKKTKRPEILFYFNQKPSNLSSKKDLRQRSKVLDFKKRFPKEGLSWSYTGRAEFLKQANDHLRKYLGEQIVKRGKRKLSRVEPVQLNATPSHRKFVFSLKLEKHGTVLLPKPLLRQLGLTDGDTIELTVAGAARSEHKLQVISTPIPSKTTRSECLEKQIQYSWRISFFSSSKPCRTMTG